MHLCVWTNNKCNRINLKNDKKGSQFKVEDLKKAATSCVENIDNYVFVYKGCVLNNDNYVEEYEIGPDAEIILLEKHPPSKAKQHNVTDDELWEIAISYKTFVKNPAFRSNVLKIVNSSIFQDMKNLFPEVVLDTTALGILTDPELLKYLADHDTVKALSKEHPVLIPCASYLQLYFGNSNISTKWPSAVSGYSYSLEALSDDELEGESSQTQGLTSQTTTNSITRAQLAQALANASYHAQLRSLAFDTPSTSRGAEPNDAAGSSTRNEDLSKKYSGQLKIMRNMGMVQDDINIRALEAAGGDIERAVEFVLLSQNQLI